MALRAVSRIPESGLGTVTSVALSAPTQFGVSGSPVTGAGTLTFTLATQNPNLVWASDGSGATAQPDFRALVDADIPSALTGKTISGLTVNTTTGSLTIANAKLVTFSNSLVFAGTDASTVTFGAGGTVLYSGQGISTTTLTATGPITAFSGTGIPAGGGATPTGLKVSSTANFGVFVGSGAPTLTAAKGSIYMRSDGGGVNDRGYIATDSAGTWTAIITVG